MTYDFMYDFVQSNLQVLKHCVTCVLSFIALYSAYVHYMFPK